jgi:GT2 family glycosyltransferase
MDASRRWVVVIPSNNAERLRRCVASIIDKHAIAPTRIIVVDDGAKKDWTDTDPKVVFVDGIKPFIYSRNANIGITAAGDNDVVLLGDDVVVKTPLAFDILCETSSRARVGAVSAAIDGPVGNTLQRRHTTNTVRESGVQLCFVCVYLPRSALQIVGPLDEQFDGYGFDDTDWCWRAQDKRLRLLIDDRVVVLHDEKGAYRSLPDYNERSARNLELARKKWPGRV